MGINAGGGARTSRSTWDTRRTVQVPGRETLMSSEPKNFVELPFTPEEFLRKSAERETFCTACGLKKSFALADALNAIDRFQDKIRKQDRRLSELGANFQEVVNIAMEHCDHWGLAKMQQIMAARPRDTQNGK
jgi:hypothetical protein